MSFANERNVLLIVATLPFMVCRINQEERLLTADPDYRRYISMVRYRLFPGVV